MSSQITYNYVDKEGGSHTAILENTSDYKLLDAVSRAKADIDNAKRFYQDTFYPLWRE